MPKKNKINKKDGFRVLLTDTLPYETPITFSVDYIYTKLTSKTSNPIQKKLVDAVILNDRKATVPYRYQIRKTEDSLRRLALIHPSSQWLMTEFYGRYSSLMLHYTSQSEITIRSPTKIAGSFYTKKSWEDIYKYKDGSVSINDLGEFTKHSPSYFTYRGFDRLWKFYNSEEYIELERKFSHLATMDVSKCFDSIYTHCMSWATKDKQFSKDNLRCKTFGDDFDNVIRHGNHDETNGIPIGPESSRVFAEIILQQVDRNTVRRLLPRYVFNKQYSIRRYVDDIFIYAESEATANIVKIAYTECLLMFNLHVNPLKSQLQTRPFATKKSTLVSLSLEVTETLSAKIFSESGSSLGVAVVYEPELLLKKYIASIKTICQQVESNYYDISSLLIAIFVERIKKVCEGSCDQDIEDIERLKCLKLVLDVCFFLYGVAPTVNASYKLSTAIILLIRYFRTNRYTTSEQMCNYIFHSVQRLLLENNRARSTLVSDFIDLEIINIVLASQELGPSFLLSSKIVKSTFLGDSEKNYFSLSACLFYIGPLPRYAEVLDEVVESIEEKLGDCKSVKSSSEIAHIFLDAISCPHIPTARRAKWVRACLSANGDSVSVADATVFVAEMGDEWTAPWIKVDLLNSLEKRELKRAY